MAIGDRLRIEHHPKQGYYLARGGETFYDAESDDEWITFDTADEARAWAVANLGEDPYDNYEPEDVQERAKERPADLSDLPLFGRTGDG